MGLLALPTLEHVSLLATAREVYGGLKDGFYGLTATLLTLVFPGWPRSSYVPMRQDTREISEHPDLHLNQIPTKEPHPIFTQLSASRVSTSSNLDGFSTNGVSTSTDRLH